MSQSRTVCPSCQRPPGSVHPDGCPRSRAKRIALHARLTKPPRLLWKKGFLAYKKPRKWLKGWDMATVFNPGVPRVVYGSNPRAGGIPRGKKAEAGIFLQALGIEPGS